MVVTENHLASDIGVGVLKKGGNAIDAAIASAFALAVVHPQAGNIGGGGFLVYQDEKGRATTIDFRETAPMAASKDMFLDTTGDLRNGSNHEGALSIGVPGTVAGLFMAHEKYGTIPWSDLLEPAIDLASEGFPLTMNLYKASEHFRENEERFPFMAQFFGSDEKLKFGDIWRQPALASTLRQIQKNGRDGFYRGFVANAIEKFMVANGGLITREDLAKYQALEREPIHGTFMGLDIHSMPPPSSGGVTLVNMLNMVEHVMLDTLEFGCAAYFHTLAEIMRRAYADRAEHLGDPDFNPNMPLDQLLSKAHGQKRASNIRPDTVSISDPSVFGRVYGGDNTTHLSVVDEQGNAVSLTYTLEYSYGSRMGSEELGFIFNNEMGDFNPVAGETTEDGQIGTDPNLIEPGKRMLSSMTPTIVSKDGKVMLVIGSPGGRTIINTVFQTIVNVILHEMEISDAIETAKIHHQWLPDRIYYEKNLMPLEVRESLEQRGHQLQERNYLGRLMGIRVDTDSGLRIGHSDSASPDGSVTGY